MNVELEEVVKLIRDFCDGACERGLREEGELESRASFTADEWWRWEWDILERPMGVGNVFTSVTVGGGDQLWGWKS